MEVGEYLFLKIVLPHQKGLTLTLTLTPTVTDLTVTVTDKKRDPETPPPPDTGCSLELRFTLDPC